MNRINFIPEKEKEKEKDPEEKSVVVKLTTNLAGEALPNPTMEFQDICNQGTVEHYVKWISSLHIIISNHTLQDKCAVALKMLKGSDRLYGLHSAMSMIQQQTTEVQREALFVASIDILSVHVIKEDFVGIYQT
jgi:hypothetical protein